MPPTTTVWLTRRECTRDGELPPVCVCCGEDADRTVRQNFSWYPPWVNVLFLAGLLPLVVVALITTKRMSLYAPVCDAHRGHWLRRKLVHYAAGFTALFLLFALMIGGIAYASNNPARSEFALIGTVTGIAAFAVFITIALVAQRGMVRALDITDRDMRLTRVSAEFVRAVKRQRREDDEDDYEEDDE